MEGITLGSRARASSQPMKVQAKITLSIPGHTVAENKIVHPATHVDRIDLNETMMLNRGLHARHRRIEQQSAPMETARIAN